MVKFICTCIPVLLCVGGEHGRDARVARRLVRRVIHLTVHKSAALKEPGGFQRSEAVWEPNQLVVDDTRSIQTEI